MVDCMKKDRIVLLGLSLLALSCAGEKGVFPDGEVLTFTADWVSPEETRTVLKSDGTTVWWEPATFFWERGLRIVYRHKYPVSSCH